MITPNENLRRARLGKHWSVAAASREVGVSTNTFNRWERGVQIPQMATLDQLCVAFAMSADDLGFGYVLQPQKKSSELEIVLEEHVEGERSTYDQRIAGTCAQPVKVERHPLVINSLIKRSAMPPLQSLDRELNRDEAVSRRKVIATLIGMPAAAFGTSQGALLHAEEILTLCATHIPLCWQLYFEGGLVDVERVLPDYIDQLSLLVEQPSANQQRAAGLLSQAYQLASLLATQHQDYGRASACARQGLYYGKQAEDPSLQVASSIREALVSFYLKRARPCYYAYQRALQLVPQTSPLLQGRVYVGLAEVYSQLRQEEEAWSFLDLARETFPLRAEDDPNFAYTHFTGHSVSTFEGRMHLNLQQPVQAWQAFARIDQLLSREVAPNRLELTVHQAMTAFALGELEQTCDLLEIAVPMAQALNSQLRLDESYAVYERMLAKWSQEPVVRDLEGLFCTIADPG